jgi:chromosome segregation ATPase
MNECLPIKQICHQLSTFCSEFQLPPFETCKSLCTNLLVNRVTNHWKTIVMDCNTAIAVSCCAVAFFCGSNFLCSIFAIMAISSGVSAFYMRRFSTLNDLEATAKKINETKEKLEQVTQDLKRENHHLTEINRELERNNQTFSQTNRELQITNEALRQVNVRLTTQVAQLALQVTQLHESAERIRAEMLCFQQENSHLHNHVQRFDQSLRVLDQQILASKGLCEQITIHLATEQQGLNEQLSQLRQYLSELRAENRVYERIQELGELQQQAQRAATQLHQIQLQYAAERANFQAIHEALVQLRNQFDTAIQDAVSSMQGNNQQFRDQMSTNQDQFQKNIAELSEERGRIGQMLEMLQTRVLGNPPGRIN